MSQEQKKEEALKKIIFYGMPFDSKASGNNTVLDALCRMAMRYVSGEAYDLIDEIKAGLNDFFSPLKDEAITSILEAAPESRCELATTAVRDFCSAHLKNIDSSFNITVIDALISAINYTLRDQKSVNAEAKKAVQTLIPDVSPHISQHYPERTDEISPGRIDRDTEPETKVKDVLIAPKRQISEVSGYDTDSEIEIKPRPKTPPKRQLFTSTGLAELSTLSGVPLVGHVSGTISGNLTVVKNLLKKYRNKDLSEKETRIFAAFSAASFHRSGFHSPLEVLVGFCHYSGLKITKETLPQNKSEVRKLYKESLELITEVLRPDLKKLVNNVMNELVNNPNLTMQDLLTQLMHENLREQRLQLFFNSQSDNLTTDNDLTEQEEEDLYAEIEKIENKRDETAIRSSESEPQRKRSDPLGTPKKSETSTDEKDNTDTTYESSKPR